MTHSLLVQLTDLHIREPGRLAYGRIDTAPMLCAGAERAASAAGARCGGHHRRPSDFGRAAEYTHMAELLAPLTMPIYLMPGTHDHRDELRRSFPMHSYLGDAGTFVQYSVKVGGLRRSRSTPACPATATARSMPSASTGSPHSSMRAATSRSSSPCTTRPSAR